MASLVLIITIKPMAQCKQDEIDQLVSGVCLALRRDFVFTK